MNWIFLAGNRGLGARLGCCGKPMIYEFEKGIIQWLKPFAIFKLYLCDFKSPAGWQLVFSVYRCIMLIFSSMTATLQEAYYLPIHDFHIAHNTPCLSSKRFQYFKSIYSCPKRIWKHCLYNLFLWGGGCVNKVYLYFGQYLHVLAKNLVKNCFLRITCKFLCFALWIVSAFACVVEAARWGV